MLLLFPIMNHASSIQDITVNIDLEIAAPFITSTTKYEMTVLKLACSRGL